MSRRCSRGSFASGRVSSTRFIRFMHSSMRRTTRRLRAPTGWTFRQRVARRAGVTDAAAFGIETGMARPIDRYLCITSRAADQHVYFFLVWRLQSSHHVLHQCPKVSRPAHAHHHAVQNRRRRQDQAVKHARREEVRPSRSSSPWRAVTAAEDKSVPQGTSEPSVQDAQAVSI